MSSCVILHGTTLIQKWRYGSFKNFWNWRFPTADENRLVIKCQFTKYSIFSLYFYREYFIETLQNKADFGNPVIKIWEKSVNSLFLFLGGGSPAKPLRRQSRWQCRSEVWFPRRGSPSCGSRVRPPTKLLFQLASIREEFNIHKYFYSAVKMSFYICNLHYENKSVHQVICIECIWIM